MKAKSKVQVRTSAGLVEAPCFHQWKQTIGGMEFEFALHIAAGHPKGFVAPLAISELETGFDTKAVLTHPVTRVPLTSSNIQGLKPAQLKSVAKSALHNLIHRRVGAGRFLQAMLGAQMQLSKIDLSKYEEGGSATLAGLAKPGTATISGKATPEQAAVLTKLIDGVMGVCDVCQGSKVVSTTDKDHDGNNIEITCPACIPKAIQLTETKVGDIPRHAPELTEADLPLLRHQRDQLQLLADQHGTMTGDTTEQDYEVLTEEIEELDQHIANLECKPC